MLTRQYLLSFAQNFWPRKREKGGGRKGRKDKILYLVVLSSQVVPVGFCFICTGWGEEKKKTRWNSDKAQEMFEPDNKLPFVQGSGGKRREKRGRRPAETNLSPALLGTFLLPTLYCLGLFVLLRCLVIILFALGPLCAAF